MHIFFILAFFFHNSVGFKSRDGAYVRVFGRPKSYREKMTLEVFAIRCVIVPLQ